MWNLTNETNKQNKIQTDIDTENKQVVAKREGGGSVGAIGERD